MILRELKEVTYAVARTSARAVALRAGCEDVVRAVAMRAGCEGVARVAVVVVAPERHTAPVRRWLQSHGLLYAS
jgi:hypothetical protein